MRLIMKRTSYFYIILLFITITWAPLLGDSESRKPLISSQQGTSSNQQLVEYFQDVFAYDWNLGADYVYDPIENMAQQSYHRDGSSYTPYEYEHIEDTMSITPIFSPDNSESLIISLIENATSKLYIEQMYIYYEIETYDIIQAIIDAHGRGVEVKVILGENNDESGETAENLTTYGIPVRISVEKADNGNYFNTMHNKGVISDDQVLIASINWSPTSIFDNREAGLIIESSEVVDYFEMIFDYDWIASEVYDPIEHYHDLIPVPNSGGTNSPSEYTPQFANPQTFTGEFEVDLLVSPDNSFEILEDLILNAQDSIYISLYTLSSPYLLEALRDRVSSGLDVRLLLEQNQFSSWEKKYNRHTLYNLTEIGVSGNFAQGRWAAFDGEFTYQHCKYAIIDYETLILSSGNWSKASCPKPQDDGDVDGNRDWWIVINSNEIESENTNESFEKPTNLRDIFLNYILPGIGVIALVGIAYIIIKVKM